MLAAVIKGEDMGHQMLLLELVPNIWPSPYFNSKLFIRLSRANSVFQKEKKNAMAEQLPGTTSRKMSQLSEFFCQLRWLGLRLGNPSIDPLIQPLGTEKAGSAFECPLLCQNTGPIKGLLLFFNCFLRENRWSHDSCLDKLLISLVYCISHLFLHSAKPGR